MKKFLTIMLALGLLTLPLGVAQSQSRSDWREILVRVSELEGQLEALKRDAASAGGSEIDGSQRVLLADMEIRIGQIETEIRKLTGLVEEIAFNQNRIEKEFDLFKRDVDLRFKDLGNSGTVAALTPDPVVADEPKEEELTRTAEIELPTVTLPEGTEAERYDYAFSFLRRGDFPSAEAALKSFLEAHPAHSLAGNAQYWLGETYYVRKDYPLAAAAFLKGFQSYGEGAKGPDSLLKLGMSLSSMNQNQQACSAFEELLSRYPEATQEVLNKGRTEQERLGCL